MRINQKSKTVLMEMRIQQVCFPHRGCDHPSSKSQGQLNLFAHVLYKGIERLEMFFFFFLSSSAECSA